jgi:hypothetical protein
VYNVEERYLQPNFAKHSCGKLKVRPPLSIVRIGLESDKPSSTYLNDGSGAIDTWEPIYVTCGANQRDAQPASIIDCVSFRVLGP